MARKVNQATIDLIKEFEGFRANAYRDAVGVWTIGYGHTSRAGDPKVKPGMRITRAEGERILKKDVAKFAADVERVLGDDADKLNDNQFGAIVSFAYNVGIGNLKRSSVLKAIRRGDLDAVPAKLKLWNKAGGKVLKGLVRRRKAEGELFMRPVDSNPVVAELHESAPEPSTAPPAKRGVSWPVAIISALLAAAAASAAAFFDRIMQFLGVGG